MKIQREEYRTEERRRFICVCPLRAKVGSYCFRPLFLNVAVVRPIQAVTVIKNYIIKLQVRGQKDKEY